MLPDGIETTHCREYLLVIRVEVEMGQIQITVGIDVVLYCTDDQCQMICTRRAPNEGDGDGKFYAVVRDVHPAADVKWR